jgi:subtilisin family serine protease
MRDFACIVAAWLAMLAGSGAGAAPPPDTPAPQRIIVAFANQPHAVPAPPGSTGSRYSGSGYLVGQSAQRQARQVASAYRLREVASWPIQVLSMHCVVFEIADGRSAAEVLAKLSKDPAIALAQPLQEFHTLTDAVASTNAVYNDPLYDLQTNLTTLGIARAHRRTQGAGVRVALIDTGVDAGHPDLEGRIAGAHSFIPSPAPDRAALRHGTAMAGVIAAVANNHIGIVGIAPRAQIEVFEACWQLVAGSDAATCNTFTVARALAAALASGAPLVNLSFGGPDDPLLTALVQVGLKRGVTFVGAAAGANSPFPTSIPGVLTAAASEQTPPPGALAAPAQHVMTLRPGGEYDFESGTSVAAAEITAVIALVMSASPTRLSTSDIVAALREGAGAQPAAAPVPAAPVPVDVNAALAQLDAHRGGGAVAARGAEL